MSGLNYTNKSELFIMVVSSVSSFIPTTIIVDVVVISLLLREVVGNNRWARHKPQVEPIFRKKN
jgi:hypothetical protein